MIFLIQIITLSPLRKLVFGKSVIIINFSIHCISNFKICVNLCNLWTIDFFSGLNIAIQKFEISLPEKLNKIGRSSVSRYVSQD